MRALVIVVLLLAGSTAHALRCPPGSATGAFVARGAFGVGVRAFSFEDQTRPTPPRAHMPALPTRTITGEVWYPTEPSAQDEVRDAALVAGSGPFPLIVHSPGLLDNHDGEAYYARHLASRGFVVATLDFPSTDSASLVMPNLTDLQRQPGDVSFVIDVLLNLSTLDGTWLTGGIDAQKIGVSGLSLGGATTVLVTYHPEVRDPRVRAALAMAPAGGCAVNRRLFRAAHPPLLILQGEDDLLVSLQASTARLFRLSRSPRELVVLKHGTHVAFAGVPFPAQQTNYDLQLGCGLLLDIQDWGDPFAGLGGARAGIDADGAQCVLPCKGPTPSAPPMLGARQQKLTLAVGAAFFESTLRGSTAATCFLRRSLAAENADVQVERRGR